MRTSKCGAIIAGCITLIIIGLLLLEWLILIFLLPLVLLLFLAIIMFYGKEIEIEVIRELSNIKIFENDTCTVKLKIKNHGEKIPLLELFDTLPKKVKIIKNSNYALVNLEKKEEITLKYEIRCPSRGRFILGPLLFRVKGFFGMFYKEAMVETNSSLTVIPQIQEIKDIQMKAKPNIYPGIMQVKHAGIGTEFYGIRKYTTGDTIKRINWKAFARFKDLMVNEYELESTTDLILIVDARENQTFGTMRHNALEYSIKAAVSIASHFLKRRDRVGLISYGDPQGQIKWLYPESGKKQLYKIIEELVSIQAYGDFPFNGVVYRSSTHLLPKKSLVVFISSLEEDPSIPNGLEQLIAFNYNVIIISPSTIDLDYSLKTTNRTNKLTHRILNFQRNNLITDLRKTGAKVIDWNPTLPLAASLKEVEKYHTRR